MLHGVYKTTATVPFPNINLQFSGFGTTGDTVVIRGYLANGGFYIWDNTNKIWGSTQINIPLTNFSTILPWNNIANIGYQSFVYLYVGIVDSDNNYYINYILAYIKDANGTIIYTGTTAPTNSGIYVKGGQTVAIVAQGDVCYSNCACNVDCGCDGQCCDWS